MKREKKKHLPIISGIIILLIVLWITFLCDYSFWRKARVTNELHQVQKKIANLKKQNKILEDENKQLLNDPKTWEREARNIGMQKKDEKVILFQKQNKKNK